MADLEQRYNAELLDRLVALAHQRLGEDRSAPLEPFLRQYYARVPVDHLSHYSLDTLLASALAHLELGRERRPGGARVRAYNPDRAADGWETAHTVVEMVNDDMPFLVDSTLIALQRLGLQVHLAVHPILAVRRSSAGWLEEVVPASGDSEDALVESFLRVEVTRVPDGPECVRLEAELAEVLADVRAAVDDWQAMRGRAAALEARLGAGAPWLDTADLEEIRAFLQWLVEDHFTFLGCADLRVVAGSGGRRLEAVPDSALGLLGQARWRGELEHVALPPGDQPARDLLVLTKAAHRSTVHRPSYLDYIGIRHFDADGALAGESRFLGLYTSAAYHRSARTIPLLRRKVEWVMVRSGLRRNSHAGKALLHVLETLPRDELIQAGAAELLDIGTGVVDLQERQRTRLFRRRDPYGRFESCLVYVPRERYQRELRQAVERILIEELGGDDVESSVQIGESALAQLHVIVRHDRPVSRSPDVARIEDRLAQAARSWEDDLRDELVARQGEAAGLRLFQRHGRAFPGGYVTDFSPAEAAADVERMARLNGDGDLDVLLYRAAVEGSGDLRFRLLRRGAAIHLSEVLPLLENLGLRVRGERPYRLSDAEGNGSVWLHEFELEHGTAAGADIEACAPLFQEAFVRVWRGEAESDGFNALVLGAGLDWREATVLRAYSRYLLQAGLGFSQAYVQEAFAANPEVATGLVRLFLRRLDPHRPEGRDRDCLVLAQALDDALDRVPSLDHDRIFRSFLTTVRATLRTNYFQRAPDGGPRPCLALKLDPLEIPLLPEPRPRYEIFVYSPEVEGVHLRGGKVARGGIRWSDRREDYRTEVLGLMKAQMIKNAVIIPVGAKGGFILRRPPSDPGPSALREAGERCYRLFISGLLDLTDNHVGGRCVPPAETVRADDDDPYLVVAADKGTAGLSDVANELARDYGFWLGDAFASGGSAGYDHKRMGITARGAWESVKRHFRETGRDIQSEPFTAVGVGDMSGDVFGNGMLLSPCIRLIAAFDHRHVFVDPDPDPEASFAERRRLFDLRGSSWADYDPAAISAGGGVFPRSAKSVRLTPEMRAALATDAQTLTPDELIRAILRAPVDLFWNGGIGTYVKARSERSLDVGDRTGDAVRVNGEELRCAVIGEGGNLGLTQAGRVEYALAGGRLNTDAIDNAGGVDCSDREVNIKILLDAVREDGLLDTASRHRLLAEMTEEVAALVVRDGYRQTQAISLMQRRATDLVHEHGQVIRTLESHGRLNRVLDGLPDEDGLTERRARGHGLTRPELAVLLAHAKIAVYDALLESDLPDDSHLTGELRGYFPATLVDRFGDRLTEHRLARGIVASSVANRMVDFMGASFVIRLQDDLGAQPAGIARAFLDSVEVPGADVLWRSLEGLDNVVEASLQLDLMNRVSGLVEHFARWFLRNSAPGGDLHDATARYAQGVAELAEAREAALDEAAVLDVADLEVRGVPSQLARRLAVLGGLYSALDIVTLAGRLGCPAAEAAEAWFAVSEELGVSWMLESLDALGVEGTWQARARNALRDDVYADFARLAAALLQAGDRTAGSPAEVARSAAAGPAVDRFSALVRDLRGLPDLDLGTLGVAARELRRLADLTETVRAGPGPGSVG